MQVQTKSVCLWLEVTGGEKCCQCTDESGEALACAQGINMFKCCSMTDQEKGLVCCNQGQKGICCCCCVGQGKGSCCDPIGAPESCVFTYVTLFLVTTMFHLKSDVADLCARKEKLP